MSGVKDFSHAFSWHRDKAGGAYAIDGNTKAAHFIGTGMSKWITTSLITLDSTFLGASKFVGTGLNSWITAAVTTLRYTFNSAREMNADLSTWKVGKVTNLEDTFNGASKFAGTGLNSWITTSLTTLQSTFWGASLVNVDFGGWDVSRVASLQNTFRSATNYVRLFSTPLYPAHVCS